jgi:glutamine cyclotransferase
MAKRGKSTKRAAPLSTAAPSNPPRRQVPRAWIWLLLVGVGAVVAVILAIGPIGSSEEDPLPIYGYEVVNSYPHDPGAYSQGLAYVDGQLYEGTGRQGSSSLRRVDLETGDVLERVPLDRKYFGEGITVWQDQVIQLTWKGRVGFVYDRASFRELQTFRYTGEGWGLTHDGKNLIMSDGTSTLRFLDPQDHRVVKRLVVRSNESEVRHLNELEYIQGEIWANVWYKDYIVRISPETGEVLGRINLSGLLPASQRPSRDAVLNGIAYDTENDRIFVTGKNWPRLFEIRVKPTRSPR